MESKVIRRLHEAAGAKVKNWELFHENSKLGLYDLAAPQEWVLQGMELYAESLNYAYLPEVELPGPDNLLPLDAPLSRTITERISTREFGSEPVTLAQVATILHYSYGINRDNAGTGYPRPFRNAPSGGALYPLDIYFSNLNISGLDQGTFHYNPTTNSLRRLSGENPREQLGGIFVQPELLTSAMVVFIAAQFERSLFKYKDRGYRFVLLDAGHLAQNMNLVATALDLGCVNVGGYYDRRADEFLGLDGLTQSTIYMVAIGTK